MKFVKVKIVQSQQLRGNLDGHLLSIRGLDDHSTSVKEALVQQGFEVGDLAAIIDLQELQDLKEKAWKYDELTK